MTHSCVIKNSGNDAYKTYKKGKCCLFENVIVEGLGKMDFRFEFSVKNYVFHHMAISLLFVNQNLRTGRPEHEIYNFLRPGP